MSTMARSTIAASSREPVGGRRGGVGGAQQQGTDGERSVEADHVEAMSSTPS
jgi:hypothetical protein